MEIIYRADDGTDFRSQEECEVYESKKKIVALNLQSRFFNHNGTQMDITDLYNCIEEGWYMEIANMVEAEFIAEYAERDVGITLFKRKPTVGRFYWDDDVEKWRNVEELYAAYAEILKVFEG